MTGRIKRVRAIPVVYRMGEAFSDSLYAFSVRSNLVVVAELDDGIVGYGEAAIFGGPPDTTRAVLEQEIVPHYLGQSPFDVERLWDEAYHRTYQHGRHGIVMAALAGVDIAVWDLLAKCVGRPLVDVLGAYRRELPCYASGGFYRAEGTLSHVEREFSGYAEQGFRAMKMKVGGATLHDDVQRVRAVRHVIGDDVELMIDANGALLPPQARRLVRELEDVDITWFEEPVSVQDRRGSRELRYGAGVRVAGYELETNLTGFRDLIEDEAIDIAQPDITWAGGITQVRKIAAYAQAWHLPVAPHCFGGVVALAATAHFLASIPNGLLLEVDGNDNPLRTELAEATWLRPRDGIIQIADRPGLGIEVDEARIERYCA